MVYQHLSTLSWTAVHVAETNETYGWKVTTFLLGKSTNSMKSLVFQGSSHVITMKIIAKVANSMGVKKTLNVYSVGSGLITIIGKLDHPFIHWFIMI